jgi:hypothetical protein
MTRRRKVFRSVVGTRYEIEQKGALVSCDHHHSTPEAASTCLAARVRDTLRRDPIGVTAAIEYSHSRHDWFPL